jgi:glycerol kinase
MGDTPIAIALDLGSTRFKLGALDADGNLEVVFTAPAPELKGSGLIREGQPAEFLRTATELVDQAAARWPGHSLGLVAQRSTFTVWHPQSGQPLAPMISWQDRGAASWCDAHIDLRESIARQSGLLLSPHYLGPKLAALQQSHPEVRHALQEDGALVGTLDAWLMWHWNQANRHQTDLTMAARTALVDIELGAWSPRLCRLFNVPLAALPQIRPSNSQSLTLDNGLRLKASIADQASGAIAELDPHEDVAMVNFGTGAFVLSPQANARTRKAGYLTAPILSTAGESTRFVLEGTINGAGPALDKFHSGPTVLPTEDDCPEGFAIPDLTGVGSPHWREDIGLTLSAAARSTSPVVKRRIVLEGLLFRVLEILLDLGDGTLPGRTLIAGGAVHDPAIGLGLAQLLQTPVGQLIEPEATLLGVARLAAGHNPFSKPAIQEIRVSSAGAYLPEKYWRWHSWVQTVFSPE